MKQVKITGKSIACIIFLVMTMLTAIIFSFDRTEAGYQKDADIIRLHHLKYYTNLIEEYKEKTGKYPLQEKIMPSFPVYVEIANSWQEADATSYNDAIPFPHYNGADKEFFEELEKGLGRSINQYYDPQKVSNGRPNFYVYLVDEEGNYYFAIHTYSAYPFSYKLAKHYYKVQVTNNLSDNNGKAIYSDDLLPTQSFNKELNKKVSNEEYFTDLENEFLHESK